MADRRLLVISHNAFGKFNNMGRTLEAIYSQWEPESIAQVYFSEESPSSDVCRHFFRISDADILKSVFKRSYAGQCVEQQATMTQEESNKIRNSNSLKSKIIKIARNRTPFIYCTRNAMWNLGRWNSPYLRKFIDDFNPECVFFASGDYSFSYKIALEIAKTRSIPLVIGCYDDFYIGTHKSVNPFYYINRHSFMKIVKQVFDYSQCFTATCDMMSNDYTKLFHKPGYPVYTPSPSQPCIQKVLDQKQGDIVYAGNLGYGRAEQLISIGQCLKKIGNPQYPCIHVYSGEVRTNITDKMNLENGICFHGSVSPAELKDIIRATAFVIHTESFGEPHKTRVKYSVSTKIADNLCSDIPMIAYGPNDVASIQYLEDHNAAFCITSPESLEEKLRQLLCTNDINCDVIIANAIKLAAENHNGDKNGKLIKSIIEGAII